MKQQVFVMDTSLDFPLVTPNDDGSEEMQQRNTHSSRNRAGLVTAFVVILMITSLHKNCHHHDGIMSGPTWEEATSNVTYGVDVSWPIHHSIKSDSTVFAKGSRHQAYVKHLQGCRSFYRKISETAARSCDSYEFDRILMNKRQPQSMQNYTDLGFAKIKAPPKVSKLIQDFWEANKHKQIPEAWPEGNVYLNHWDAPSMMVSVDDTNLRGNGYTLKKKIWEASHSTISAWTGGQDITPVSMYGIRVYRNNSVLVPHVDRLPLVASAMVNVAQDVEEDWPMEIYDHDGNAHNVTLQPGEMLLFESHSVIHGRPFPLTGKFYAMLFIHFEPTGKTPLNEKVGVDEQYRQAIQDGVGGQSSSEQNSMLPPYIRRFSPEEEHWQRENPNGWWQAPASAPLDYSNTSDSDAKPKQPEEHVAARDGDLKYWQDALAEAKEDPDQTYEVINKRDSNGWQPIHESAVNGKQAIVALLLKHGANINARTNGGRGGTALFLAQQALGSHHPVVQYLVFHGALSIPPDNFRDEL